MCAVWVQCLQRPEEGVSSPRTGIIGGCELSDIGARNWARVLWKVLWNHQAVSPASFCVYFLYFIFSSTLFLFRSLANPHLDVHRWAYSAWNLFVGFLISHSQFSIWSQNFFRYYLCPNSFLLLCKLKSYTLPCLILSHKPQRQFCDLTHSHHAVLM